MCAAGAQSGVLLLAPKQLACTAFQRRPNASSAPGSSQDCHCIKSTPSSQIRSIGRSSCFIINRITAGTPPILLHALSIDPHIHLPPFVIYPHIAHTASTPQTRRPWVLLISITRSTAHPFPTPPPNPQSFMSTLTGPSSSARPGTINCWVALQTKVIRYILNDIQKIVRGLE